MSTAPGAVIYARQSFDRHSDELAVTRQLQLCRKFAAERGWDVAAEYVDNDRSATSGVERPEFERLLAARPGRIVVWHTDRLVRLTRELERVIDLGVNVHAVEAGHLDLSHPAGRATAKTLTAWAQYETEQKAIRQRAANDQRAATGAPYRCQRAFGYEADGVTVREDEAHELRHAAEAVLRGRSLNSLAQDMNGRGVTTAPGKTWRSTTLKAALLSPRNAGLRRHRGEVIGKASWPAILDEATAVAVKALLTDPSRSQRGPARRYLLSGVLTCGRCGGPVVGAYVKGKGETYRCQQLHVTRKTAPIDEFVTGLVAARLAMPDAVSLFTREGNADRAQALTAERASLRVRLDGLAEAFGAGDIDRQALSAGSRRIQERLNVIDAEIAASVDDPTLREVATADDVAAAFTALPLETRRKIIGSLLHISLLPVGSGHRSFDPSASLGLTWR